MLSDFDVLTSWSKYSNTITLEDDNIQVKGSGVTVTGNTVAITAEGTYVFSGTLTDGQIAVSATNQDKVHIVLNGVNISNSESAPLYVANADKVTVTLAKDTENKLSDLDREVIDEDAEINACVFASDDITFNGEGKLVIDAINNGIGSKNDVRICGGTIDISARNHGIKGKDSVYIAAGDVKVVAGKDGLKATNISDADRGYVLINGGNVHITAKDDGIQAITEVIVSGGFTKVASSDQKINCDGTKTITPGCLG